MALYESIWIKQEGTDEVPDETDTTTGKKEVMDHYETVWIKQEETDGVSHETGTVVQIQPPSTHVKEVVEDDVNQEVSSPTRCESSRTQLIQSNGESCGSTFEETANEEVVCNELVTDTEKSSHFTMFSTRTQELTEEEKDDGLHGTELKCNFREKEFNRFNCNFCLQSFSSKYMLIMHVFAHIDGVKSPTYVCKSCGEVFPTNIRLNEHMKINVGDQASSSGRNDKTDSICNNHEDIFLKSDQENSLTEHTETHLSSKVTTKLSERSFNYLHDQHTATHLAEKQDIHESCGTSSMTSSITNDSLDNLLVTAKRSHTCDICGKSFTNSGNLKRHVLIHSGTRPHKCDVCCKSFTELGTLKTHVLLHFGVKPYKCDICGKSFTQSSHLKSHSLTHSGETPYKCGVCGMTFTDLGNRKRHALTHTGIRPHKCEICGKSFTESGNLKRHALIHTGTRQHKCNVCDKSFTQLGDLKRHMLTHTGERPYKCDTCGKSFTQSSIFKRHERIHSRQRPHKCDMCDKSFTRLDQLKTHALIHTSVIPHV